ncbi:MAG: alginate export family protein [Methylococcaceae bacterium]
MRIRFFAVLVGVLLINETVSAGMDAPKFKNMRFNENWSNYHAVQSDGLKGFYQSLKHLNLSDNGKIWISFGGQSRLRYEYFDGFGFGASANNSDHYLYSRFRLHTDLHIDDWARVYVEGISSHSSNRDLPGGQRAIDIQDVDLLNAFIEFKAKLDCCLGLRLRVGRQELGFGRQRLISPLNWLNTRNSWDGVRAIVNWNDWEVSGFWTRPIKKQKYEVDAADNDRELFGIYSKGKVNFLPGKIETYFLGTPRKSRTYNGTTGNENRYTIGGRQWANIGTSDVYYEVEGAYQFGRIGNDSIDAFTTTAVLGIKPAEWPMDLDMWLGFDYGSGDENAGGNVNTFDPLFATGFGHYGHALTLNRFNTIDARLGMKFNPGLGLKAKVEWHNFWRAQKNDAVYNIPGGVIVPGNASDDRYIGSEIDLVVKKPVGRHHMLMVGYSHIFAGSLINSGIPSAEDIDYAYALWQFTF